MPDYSNRNKLDALSEKADELVTEINRLSTGTGRQLEGVEKKQRRNAKIGLLVLLSFVIDVVVTVVVGFTVFETSSNTDKVDKITQRLDYQQTVTRKKVLCPLYQIFVDSKSAEARKTYVKGPKEYDRIFGIIQDSYNTIECAKFKTQTQKP